MKIHTKIIQTAGAILLLTAALAAGGCASIVHGGARNIAISSEPPGAKFTVKKVDTGEIVHAGTTPMIVSLSPKRGYFRGQAYAVTFTLAGYKQAEVIVRPQLSGWYFGNIVFGGLIGMLAVDPVTGAMWNLSPDKIQQPLSEAQAAVIKNGQGFMVVLVSQLTESEKANLVRIN